MSDFPIIQYNSIFVSTNAPYSPLQFIIIIYRQLIMYLVHLSHVAKFITYTEKAVNLTLAKLLVWKQFIIIKRLQGIAEMKQWDSVRKIQVSRWKYTEWWWSAMFEKWSDKSPSSSSSSSSISWPAHPRGALCGRQDREQSWVGGGGRGRIARPGRWREPRENNWSGSSGAGRASQSHPPCHSSERDTMRGNICGSLSSSRQPAGRVKFLHW